MSRYVIINADDLGMSRGVNKGIEAAHRQGIVTSTSILATGNEFDAACGIARRCPELGIGIHLAWVESRPVSDPKRVPTLVDTAGNFTAGWSGFFSRCLLGKISLDEVESEGAAQIERVLAAGFRPDHVNSHEHVHMWPPVFERVKRLAEKYRIPVVRVTREPLVDGLGDCARPWGWMRRTVLDLLASRQPCRYRDGVAAGSIWSARACFGLADSCALTEPRLLRFLAALPEGVSEVMCHPGEGNDAYGDRDTEMRALMSPAAKRSCDQRGASRITFAQATDLHKTRKDLGEGYG